MADSAQFLIDHGEGVIFWIVFLEQLGLPLPALPVLIAGGALAAVGKLNPTSLLILPVVASLGPDIAWYYLGRSKGGRVLGWLCRISLEPDTCVRKTENAFLRYGARSLLVAKFIPGLSTVTPPLAGIVRMGFPTFLLYDGIGAVIWVGVSAGLGALFSDQLGQLGMLLARTGTTLVSGLALGLGLFIAVKYYQRMRFLRDLSMNRITVDELKHMMDRGEPVHIVDVRHPVDLEANPHVIPGATQLLFEEVKDRHHEIPRDRDIVLYCSCPNEITSARTALQLKRKGITRVRPLIGGIDAWKDRQFPVEVWGQRMRMETTGAGAPTASSGER